MEQKQRRKVTAVIYYVKEDSFGLQGLPSDDIIKRHTVPTLHYVRVLSERYVDRPFSTAFTWKKITLKKIAINLLPKAPTLNFEMWVGG